MKDTRVSIVLRKHAPTTVRVMESALTEFALVRTVGVVKTVQVAAQVTDNAAAEMESVSKASATATQAGLVMPVIFVHAFTTALNMDTATTELACARRDTGDVIAPCHQNHNPANAPSIVFEAALDNAQRFTRPKVLVLPTNATPNVPRSVFLNVLPERCQLL